MRPNDRYSNSGQSRSNGKNGRNGKGTSSAANPPAEQRNLRDYLLMIRERWFLGFIVAIVLVGGLAFMQLRKPPVYEARASLLFEPTTNRVIDIKEVVDTSLQGGGANDPRLQTHIEQIRSVAFFNFVSSTFNEEERAAIITPYIRPDRDPPSIGAVIYNQIGAGLSRGTYIISVSARHRDAEVAAMIANRYAQRYIEFNRERTVQGNLNAVNFLERQSQELLATVERSENLLNEYRRQHNLISFEENQNAIMRHLNGVSAQLIEARVARLELDSKLEQVDLYLQTGEDLVEIDSIANYGSIATLRTDLERLLTERALFEQRYLENHPRMIQNKRAVDALDRLLTDNINMAVTELRSRHRRALQHERRMELELAEAEQRSLALEDVAVRFHALRNQVQADRDAHSQIVERLNETRIASQLDHVNIKVVDMADTPYLPVEPNLQRIILQSAFLGCFIFIGLPLGLGMIDNKLKASWEVELLLGLPMLGEIPRLSGIKKQDRPHLISQNKDHAACEAFRGIFSQIQLNSPLDLPRIILVTSTVPGEGKSMVCSNLAATFAAHGKRTLLVDCDFRRPSMNKHYERKNDRGIMKWVETGQDHPGLLEDNEFLDIVPLSNNLHLLRTGGDSRNPTEMFDKPGFRTLFEQFKADYDVILIDTPPVGIFPDALLLSRLCDQIIYVCQFNRVNKTQIRKFMDKVETAHVEMAGLILNGIPSGKTSAYYDYYGYGQVGNKEYKAYYAQKR